MSSTSSSAPAPYSWSRSLLVVALLAGLTGGCGDSCCTEEPLIPNRQPVCAVPPTGCDGNNEFRFGRCDQGGCGEDVDCCPGMRCRRELNLCFPLLLDTACEVDADCQDKAQVCAQIRVGERDPLPVCIFQSCSGDSDCGFGRTCYANHCVADTPCGGSCPTGSVCDVQTNTCHPLSTELGPDPNGFDRVSEACFKECTDGLMVLTDPLSMTGEICCAIDCACRPLPPVVPSRIGRYARVEVGQNAVLVSAYDAEFGDLVVARYSPQTGGLLGFDYVDGVPDVPPTADPTGPRGGVRAPGPNVGTHTSIAVDAAGLGRVAYHDVDNNGLKVAIEGPAGVWNSHTVDTASAQGIGALGTFTDIAVDAGGTIHISYLAHNTALTGVQGAATGLKLARSRTPLPQSGADWEIFVVDARPIVEVPGQRAEAREMPRGRGLHTAILLEGGAALVAYYDGGEGVVRVARFQGTQAQIFVLDGDGTDGRLVGDVGRFPTLGVHNNELLVVYEDPTRHQVRFWKGPTTTPGQGGAYGIADQLREQNRSGNHFVGAGARIATGASRPVLVHQDATTLDLRFGTLEGAAWTATTVLSEGAHGFYSDVAVSGNRAFVCSVVAELDARGRERSRLRLDIQELP
jgi:hypothetical protein